MRESMDKTTLKRCIRSLAERECSQCVDGRCALTGGECRVINLTADHDGLIECDYFLEAVLPADWTQDDLIWYASWYGEEEDDDD